MITHWYRGGEYHVHGDVFVDISVGVTGRRAMQDGFDEYEIDDVEIELVWETGKVETVSESYLFEWLGEDEAKPLVEAAFQEAMEEYHNDVDADEGDRRYDEMRDKEFDL
jgi:hypothetical protein